MQGLAPSWASWFLPAAFKWKMWTGVPACLPMVSARVDCLDQLVALVPHVREIAPPYAPATWRSAMIVGFCIDRGWIDQGGRKPDGWLPLLHALRGFIRSLAITWLTKWSISPTIEPPGCGRRSERHSPACPPAPAGEKLRHRAPAGRPGSVRRFARIGIAFLPAL